MWFVTNNINLHSIEWELIMFINIRAKRLHSMDWKSSLTRISRGGIQGLFKAKKSFHGGKPYAYFLEQN